MDDILDIIISRIIKSVVDLVRLWTRVFFVVIGPFLDLLCDQWCRGEPEGIGEELLGRVRPCPLTAQRARLPNSGFKEDKGISRLLNSIFHPGAATCFRQVEFNE